ncbi:hypothetical protein [Natribaculum luteum]|uniref:hypothetical protein n=1 Tax=Natribaculum luteum TaxID=1586232 RepID=UPI001FF61512|nr:hypothetical protein [Natribaculum luteum]
MAESVPALILFFAIPVGMVGFLVCHEFGHALPILLTGGRAHITIGSPDGQTATIGRLSLTVGIDGISSLFRYGTCQSSGVDSTFVRAIGILGGPLVTGSIVCALGGILLRGVDGVPFWVVVNLLLSEGYRAYQTIVPKTYTQGPYEGLASDGKRFLQLLQS